MVNPDQLATLDDSKAYRLPPLEYVGLMGAVNANTTEKYQRLLAELPLPERACLVLVGSDGKKERHEQSASEFRLFTSGYGIDPGPLTADILKLIHPLHIQLGPNHLVETIALDGTVPTSYAFGDPKRPYPDRSINTHQVVGSTTTYKRARMQALAEMTANHHTSRRIREHMKYQLADYRKTMDTGMFRGNPTFFTDEMTNTGVQYYNEDPNQYSVGFKSGFLRATQRQLDRYTIYGIREAGWQIDQLTETLPSGTIHRLEFMRNRGLISASSASQLVEAYAWFLQQYHHAQREYKRMRAPVSVLFNLKMFSIHSQTIRNFTHHNPGNTPAREMLQNR